MADDETPRRRNNRRSRRLPVVSEDGTIIETGDEPEEKEEEIIRGSNREIEIRNERGSTELLRLLGLHHRHGYGEYNTPKE